MHRDLRANTLNHIPAPLIRLDSVGAICAINQEACKLLGKEEDSLIGDAFLEGYAACHPQDIATELNTHFEVHASGRTHFIHCRILRTPGDCSLSPGFFAALFDRSDWVQVNEERDRLMEMATINEILPTILHELKNPLASIQALVELMTEDCEESSLRKQLHGILMEIRRMNLSFEGLGSTARNLGSSRHQAIDYGIREACTIFQRQVEAQGIELVTRIDPLPLLPLDTGTIRGLLFNLLNNAKQACRGGDVIRVNAGLAADQRHFILCVSDNGPGMPPEILEKCDQLFFTTKLMGSGIGLALCKSAVEKVKGQFKVDSSLGRGTQIKMILPLTYYKQRSEHESG